MPKFHVVTLDEAQGPLLEKTVRSGTAHRTPLLACP
jgi:hypothetical protein